MQATGNEHFRPRGNRQRTFPSLDRIETGQRGPEKTRSEDFFLDLERKEREASGYKKKGTGSGGPQIQRKRRKQNKTKPNPSHPEEENMRVSGQEGSGNPENEEKGCEYLQTK